MIDYSHRHTPELIKMKTQGNTLSQETSPYLLQHADNPVHWQPWNKQALELAQQENKAILLSIAVIIFVGAGAVDSLFEFSTFVGIVRLIMASSYIMFFLGYSLK